ncbi:MAG: YHS domain-containing protein [Rhizobiales bacterium]|nr:YHS domain-containing protein [Hyphomicrobiales bacterium]
MHMRSLAYGVALGVALATATISTSFAVDKTGGVYNTLYAGLGAKGYDVVAYFTDGKPVQGKSDFTHAYGGVTWQFASAQHRDQFKADPAKYAPQYGGFCSWGVSQGKLFDVDPVNGWKIVDGKLYLNFNGDIHKVWEKDVAGFVSKANGNWPKLNQ